MSKKIDVGFGERFKQAAENARLLELWQGTPGSQSAIAAHLGVTKQHADNWMKGTLPRADQLWQIADKFKVDPRWLATGKMYENVHKDKRITPGPKAAHKILAVLSALLDTDEEGVNEIVAAAEAVTGENGARRQRARVRGGR